MPFASHEDYFATVPATALVRLERIQQEVERQVSGASRCIAYNMPAFRQRRCFFYFAAFKKHVGIYPPLTADPALIALTLPFRGPKGNLAFPHDQELPLDLIGRVATALAQQYQRPD